MVKLKILVPDATVNYVTNPALRYDTTGWNAQGSTISRVLTRARFGIASLKVITNGSALHEGAYFRVSSLSGISEPVTVSTYVRGEGKVRIRLDNNVLGGAEFPSEGIQLNDEHWTRIEVMGFSTGGNDLRLFVETDEASATIRTFYVDGAQMERKEAATTYCDGDQDSCRWNGIYHASASQRSADTRAGGRWAQLAGEEREAEDLYMTVVGGLGMPPIVNNTQTFALADGGYYQSHRANMRVSTFTFHAKHKIDGRDDPVSLGHLHQLRQMLIDVVKPDLTGGDEDIRFAYEDGDRTLYFLARYDGGLDGEWDVRNQFVNSFPLRLLSVAPILEEDSQEAMELDFQNPFSMNYVAAKVNGQWSHLNYGFNGAMTDFAKGARGEIYAINGQFTIINNNALANDPLRATRGAIYWDGEKWVTITVPSSNSNATNSAIAVAPNGYIYVSGSFTSIGGVAANRIAYYDGSVWNAMGTGFAIGALVYDIAVAPNGDVYVVGSFSSAGGVTVTNIARWDGYQWRRVGQFGGLNNVIRTIKISADGNNLYVGGDFTQETGGGQTLSYTAQYNISTGLFSPMGNTLTGSVSSMVISASGTIYAGGTSILGTGYAAALWNGNAWVPIGSGFTEFLGGGGTIYKLEIDKHERLYATGDFVEIEGRKIQFLSYFNGSTWISLDIQFPASFASILYSALLLHPNGDLFISGNTSASDGAVLSSGKTVIYNPGSTKGIPIIYCKGPGTLKWIENQANQKRIYLNLIMQQNEEVTFDFGHGTVKSNIRGNLLYTLMPGSDFREFTLQPGYNTLACFMVDDVAAQMSIQFTPRHLSADATQIGAGL